MDALLRMAAQAATLAALVMSGTASAATGAIVATPATAAAGTRSPNEAELRSFAAYYHATPGAVAQPAFDIRHAGASGWDVQAWTENKPQRAAWSLCLAQRSGHAYDGKAWRATGETRRVVWLDRSSDCGVAQQRAQLMGELGDRDVVTVLEQQAALLQSARLLFAGNTSCAPQRAYAFTLAGLGMGKPEGKETMLMLRYTSDRGTQALVTVRKRGRELTPWNVDC